MNADATTTSTAADNEEAKSFDMTGTYSPEDNKLRLYSVARLDSETYDRVKAAGFIYAPAQECFVAPKWTPEREDLLIELCGEVGDDDTGLMDRAEQRAERFAEYSENRAKDSEQARRSVEAISGAIPFGQPILTGHHSERRHRRDIERIGAGMNKSAKMWETSEYWKRRAAAAVNHAAYKERPDVRARRIKGLESDHRRVLRRLEELASVTAWLTSEAATAEQVKNFPSGYADLYRLGELVKADPSRYEEQKAAELLNLERHTVRVRRWVQHYENRLTYERAMLEQQGGLIGQKFDIQPGGRVLVRGSWHKVKRVRKAGGQITSVTTDCRYVPVRSIEEVKDYEPPSEQEAKAAAAATKLPPLCNYPGEGFAHLTKAEWDGIHKDYKGSRELGTGAVRASGCRPDIKSADAFSQYARHRVRSAIIKGALTPVYVTDAKRSEPPKAEQAAMAA